MSISFKNNTVVITGAGSGMGRAYALAFAAEGANLALNDFDAQGLADTIQQVNAKFSVKICSSIFDVSDASAMLAFADLVHNNLGGADVIINNAGVEGGLQPAWQMPISAYERTMRINFYGVLNGSKAFLPQLIAKGQGHVVNVSSIFGLVGTPNNSDYCASKFAVRGFTEALMTELQSSNIKVHLLHPGGIATNIAKSASAKAFADHYLTTSPPHQMILHNI